MSGSQKKGPNSSNREQIVHLDPNDIAFSYSKISPTFSGCGHTVEQTLSDLIAGRLKVSDLPEIAVLENLNYSDPTATEGAGKKRASRSKRGSKKKGNRGNCEEDDDMEDDDMSKLSLPAAQRYRYFSMNNRRLYVFRRARACGVLETVPCRLKPPDVAARLLDPKGKGSRTFRLDRVCDEARLVAGKEAVRAEGQETDEGGDADDATVESETTREANLVAGHTRPLDKNCQEYEAEAVQRCLLAGLKECPQYSNEEMLSGMDLMDRVREQAHM